MRSPLARRPVVPRRKPPQTAHEKLPWVDMSDVIMTVMVMILIGGACYQPLHDWWLGSVTGAARIVDIHGKVTHRQTDALSWYPAAMDEFLNPGELIQTERTGTVRLKQYSGLEIDLLPDSLLQLKSDSSRLAQGSFRAQSNSETATFSLGQRTLKLAENTEAYFLSDPISKREQISVSKGSVTAQSSARDSTPKIIREGETLRTKPEEKLFHIDPGLHFEPRMPSQGQSILTSQSQVPIELTWGGDPADYVEMDRTSGFLTPKTFTGTSGKISVPLTVGRYYWRLVEKNRISQMADFLVLPTIDYRVQKPAPGEVVATNGEVAFQWSRIPNATQYLVQISVTSDFTNPMTSQTTKDPRAVLNPLPPGVYYWRVQAIYKDMGPWPFSSIFNFSVVAVGAKVAAPTNVPVPVRETGPNP